MKSSQQASLSPSLEEMSTSSNFIIFFFPLFLSFTDGTQLIIINNCKQSIWPGILGNTGHPTPNDGGFHLYPGAKAVLQVPQRWSGRVWGRQGCCFDQTTLTGSCHTGDCAGRLHCANTGGLPPATVVQMTLGTQQNALHYYDVSLVDGFNIPVSMRAAGKSQCGVAACEANLNVCCPASLAVRRQGKVVGCKSACLATKSDRYCCRGEYGNSKSCKPSIYGRLFKAICPRAYSYPYDESSGLKKCMANQYVITFCPSK